MSLNININPLGKALHIVETSKNYKENKAIMAIMKSLDYSRQRLAQELLIQTNRYNADSYPFWAYIQGVRGKAGYSFDLYPDDILKEFKAPMAIAQHIIEIAAKGECLILALNALGEEIEY